MRNFDIAFVQIWTMNREINSLELQAHGELSTLCPESDICIHIGKLLASRVVAEGQTIASNSIPDSPLLIDASWARHHNIIAYAGLPLFVENHLVGVLTVFAGTLLLERTLSPLAGSAVTLAQGIMRKETEEALQESEERYRSLVESSDDPIYIVGRNLKYLFANEKLLSRLGKSLDELVSQDYSQFHSPEGTQEFSAKVEQVYKSGKPVSYEHKSHRDGRVFISTLSPIINPKTEAIIAVNVISKDITEHKRIEEALRNSEKNFRNIFRFVPESLIVLSDQMKVLNSNKAFEEIIRRYAPKINISEEELRGKIISELRSHFRRKKHGFIEIKKVSEKISVDDEKKELILEFDFAGKIFAAEEEDIVVSLKDITERKRTEEEIARLAKFPSEDPEPVMRLNHDGTVFYANEACDSLLVDWGWNRGEKVPEYWRNILTEVLEKRTTRIVETQSGGNIYSFFYVPVVEAKYVNLYGRDITELKLSEKALLNSEHMLRKLQKRTEEIVDEERRRISQVIHDDLGQHLTTIILDLESVKLEMLKQGKNPLSIVIQRSMMVQKIDDINMGIQALVNRIREIATELRPVILDDLGLSAAIRWKVRQFKEHSNIHFLFKSVPVDISLNPEQNMAFFGIFNEALTNIARHAEASNIDIKLIQTPQSTTLQIDDDGQGMTMQTIDSNYSLGIYGMRERAQSVEAKFEINSEPGKGTTITVKL